MKNVYLVSVEFPSGPDHCAFEIEAEAYAHEAAMLASYPGVKTMVQDLCLFVAKGGAL